MKEFDYQKQVWGGQEITSFYTDFHGLELKWFLQVCNKYLKSRPVVYLDLGCGAGNFAFYLKKKFPKWQVLGIDLSIKSLKTISKKTRLKLFCGSLNQLPIASNSLDVVTCLDVLEHLANPAAAIGEIKRVLKPGGLAFMAVPLEAQPLTFYWPLAKINWQAKKYLCGHLQRFDDKAVKRLFIKGGFKFLRLWFGCHYLTSLVDISYYFYRRRWGRRYTAFGSFVNDFSGWKKRLLELIAKITTALGYFESKIFYWWPGGKGYFVFQKPKKNWSKNQADYYDWRGTLDPARTSLRYFGFEVLVLPKDWYLKKLLKKLKIFPKAKILDIGCGNAIFLDRLKKTYQNIKTFGIDISRQSLIRGKKQSLTKHNLVCGHVAWLPFAKNSFDFVFSFDVLEHVEEQKQVLQQAYRVLKPGGKLLFYTLNSDNLGTWDWLFAKLGSNYLYKRALHKPELYLKASQLKKMAKKAGFVKVKLNYYHGPFSLNLEILLALIVIFLEKIKITSLGISISTWGQRNIGPLAYNLDKLFFRYGWSNGFYLHGKKKNGYFGKKL